MTYFMSSEPLNVKPTFMNEIIPRLSNINSPLDEAFLQKKQYTLFRVTQKQSQSWSSNHFIWNTRYCLRCLRLFSVYHTLGGRVHINFHHSTQMNIPLLTFPLY